MRSLIILCFLILFACGCSGGKKTYQIGVDPSWFPLRLAGKDPNVVAFTNELLEEIGKVENMRFEKINKNWDNLKQGLDDEEYDGMLSSLYPYTFNLRSYSFSDLILETGPVLVTRAGANNRSNLKGKEIAVTSKGDEALLIQHYPGVTVRFTPQIPVGVNELIVEDIDGMLIDNQIAYAYIQDLYKDKIEMASDPLNDMGLRLVTKHGQREMLIKKFNRGFVTISRNGTYASLIKKWNLR